MTAAILPNTESRNSLESYTVTVDEVERKTGLKFFHLLERGRSVKSVGLE